MLRCVAPCSIVWDERAREYERLKTLAEQKLTLDLFPGHQLSFWTATTRDEHAHWHPRNPADGAADDVLDEMAVAKALMDEASSLKGKANSINGEDPGQANALEARAGQLEQEAPRLEAEAKKEAQTHFAELQAKFVHLESAYIYFFEKSHAREVYGSDDVMSEAPCESKLPGLPGAGE
jgi:hypothetical protein